MHDLAPANDIVPPLPAQRVSAQPTPLDPLRSQGYVIFERLADADQVQRLCAELEPWFAATPRCQGDFYGWNTTRFGALLLKSQMAHQLVLNEKVLAIVQQVLGPHCDCLQPSNKSPNFTVLAMH